MKPHRMKHLKEKAVRQNSMVDVAARREQEWEKKVKKSRVSLLSVGDSVRDPKDHLKPIDAAKAKFFLNYFVNHWMREKIVHLKNFHRSKRTTPGEVEGDGPFTVIENIPDKTQRRWERKNLAKRNDIDHKMIKIQNQHHKKAA